MPTRPSSLTIVISTCTTENELIWSLIAQIGFPRLYEENWHGLGEHFFYDSMLNIPERLSIIGLNNLAEMMPEAFKNLKSCLHDYQEENPDFMLISA